MRIPIFAQFEPDQLGFLDDPCGHSYGQIESICKWNSDERPLLIFNEYVCSELGRLAGLPIPPSAITKSLPEDRLMFSSLRFTFGNRQNRPVDPELFVRSQAELAAGIILFDTWIANGDRHDMNLRADSMSDPKRVGVFDHDLALFGASKGDRLTEISTVELGITGNRIGENRHCLLDEITTTDFFGDWIRKINFIGMHFIEMFCLTAAKETKLSVADASKASNFLRDRRDDLRGIITRNRDEFRGIKKWRTF